ncbi:protein abrupt-like isoform X2 [Vanessa atalanta]|uniref:protein abrupt-like isoform X2 n=1 Tax=Vanessa atalanta TaxID=42275 RepID=UPI001FCDFC89|nr:protein abrupt-like isoform X2 [Vanessa atalanta]
MLETQFSLSWEQHMFNISHGLSKFRQNGEFVDMTLAADGYFLKAHQMILSLVSPYIKDIIASLQCTHPVIFLDTSQTTSSNLPSNLIDPSVIVDSNSSEDKDDPLQTKVETLEESEEQFSMTDDLTKNEFNNNQDLFEKDVELQLECNDGKVNDPAMSQIACSSNSNNADNSSFIINQDSNDFPTPFFTISNQGSLQLVLNRHLYFLKYKSTSASGHSQWKCVNYINTKCPAYVITKNDKVIQRHIRHAHPYHDIKIAKKVASGEMFSSMSNAEEFAKTKKDSKSRYNRGKKNYTE